MTRYVALLRGINVGGNKKVPMAELRMVAEDLDWADVKTYINSGNLLFSSSKKVSTLTAELERGIADQFGFEVPVIIRSEPQLRSVLIQNPYPEGSPAQVNVAFCLSEPETGASDRLVEIATADERFKIIGSEVYVDYAGGLGRSKLAAKFDALIGVRSTTRNIRTVAKLVDLFPVEA